MRSSIVRVALAGALALSLTPVARAQVPAAAEDEPAVMPMLLKLKIDRQGKTLEHPGHMTETGSEITLVLTQGKRKHEVTVYLEKAGKGFKAEVKYKDGDKLVLEDVTTLENKKWGSVAKGKTKVSLQVDTTVKRPGNIDMPDGDSPLDGLK